jgi:hypothetical protein
MDFLAYGFSLYASPSVAACATASRERLARYIARPPIAESRLSVMADGYILLRLKRRFRNGIHSVRLHPFAFIERLCTMLPRPRRHERKRPTVLPHGALTVVRHTDWSTHATLVETGTQETPAHDFTELSQEVSASFTGSRWRPVP